MNKNTIARLAAAALAMGSFMSAQAQTAPLTRAQVVQELVDARAAGTLPRPGEWYDMPAQVTLGSQQAPLTRQAVVQELERARAAGEITSPGEGYDLPAQHSGAAPLTRAEVVAELVRARAAGELRSPGAWYDVPAQVSFGNGAQPVRATAQNDAAPGAHRTQ